MKWHVRLRKLSSYVDIKNIFSLETYTNSFYVMKYFLNKSKSFIKLQKLTTSSEVVKNSSSYVSHNFLKNKIDRVVKWYEELTGMDEVRLMQNRVIEAQNRLIQAQEKRRDASKLLVGVQNKLKDIRSELDSTTKGEERYLHLITQEHVVLKEEKNLNVQFQLIEKEERDCFAFLSSAVKESHEKERAQAERTKYWSVIGSIIGTVIGVVGSSINNEFKMKELRKLVKVSIDDRSESLLKQHEKELVSLVNEIRSFSNQRQTESNTGIDDEIVLHNLNNYQHETDIGKLLQQQKHELRATLIITSIAAIAIPIVCVLIQRLS
ncbi:mitochondrial potassium channel-like [Lycorma delicatula]|uniref:mitochondrial potassium channel-like n=1 Tax=Lycorma delicatula TaxID=130591 RepID=UPI003F5165AB